MTPSWTWFAANLTKLLYLCLVDKVWAALPLAMKNKRFFAQVMTVRTVRMLMRRRTWRRKELKRGRREKKRWHPQRDKALVLGRLSSLGKWKHALERVALSEARTSIAASIQSVESREKDNVNGSSFSWVSPSVFATSQLSISLFYLNHPPEGTSCPVPGRIARGVWRCEKQQIPISDNGDLETYPGILGKLDIRVKKWPYTAHRAVVRSVSSY